MKKRKCKHIWEKGLDISRCSSLGSFFCPVMLRCKKCGKIKTYKSIKSKEDLCLYGHKIEVKN